MPHDAYALIDYDNIRPNARERSAVDTQFNLNAIASAVADCCRASACSGVFMRLYGGWITQRGQYSVRAQWMLASLRVARGRRSGVRISPALITSPAQVPSLELGGLVRTDRSPTEQKMVDTMIAVDAVHLVNFGDIFIVSDDEDVVPPALAAASQRRNAVNLLRRQSRMHGLNDAHLGALGVKLRTLPGNAFP